MNIEEKTISETDVEVSVQGDLIGVTNQEFNTYLQDLLKRDYVNIYIDFDLVRFVDSAGLGILIGINTSLKKRKGKIFCKNLNDELLKLFRITRLDSILEIIK